MIFIVGNESILNDAIPDCLMTFDPLVVAAFEPSMRASDARLFRLTRVCCHACPLDWLTPCIGIMHKLLLLSEAFGNAIGLKFA